MFNLQQKIALITGASSGIGLATAQCFAAHGAKLILCARRKTRLEGLSQELQANYGTAIHTLELDVRNFEDVQASLNSLAPEWQAIDILVNNAGLALGLNPTQTGDITEWNQMIDTNIKGLLYMSRCVLPFMLERQRGHIVNIGSIASHHVYPNGNVYCATKHAVKALSQAIKMDLSGTPIRVSEVDPGMVNTEFSTIRFRGDKTRADAVYEGMTPLSAEDIADAILYCVTRPPHVNISEILILPTAQSGIQLVHRNN